MSTGFTALGLVLGAQDAAVLAVPAAGFDTPQVAVQDPDDPTVSLDPEADRRREYQAQVLQERARERMARIAREARIDAITPGYIKPMRWGGMGLGVVGAVAILFSAVRYDSAQTSRSEFESARLVNDLGWIAFGLGTASALCSYILQPSLPEDDSASAGGRRLQLGMGAGSLQIAGSF